MFYIPTLATMRPSRRWGTRGLWVGGGLEEGVDGGGEAASFYFEQGQGYG